MINQDGSGLTVKQLLDLAEESNAGTTKLVFRRADNTPTCAVVAIRGEYTDHILEAIDFEEDRLDRLDDDPEPPEAEPRSYDLKAVASIVETEGLGYAIECYMNETAIQDSELRDLWRRARVTMERIRALLPDLDPDDD